MENQKSTYILNTSSNLLGICFIVLTALKVQNIQESSIIDEITAIASILFMTSSMLSFFSIRSLSKRGPKYEKYADLFFIGGLITMFIITITVSYNFIF